MKKLLLGLTMSFLLISFGQAAVIDDAVSWMYNNDITISKDTISFKANNYIRRDEAAKLFLKTFDLFQVEKDYKKTEDKCYFTEDIHTSHVGLGEIVRESCRLGRFNGSGSRFYPRSGLTNAQAVAVLVRMIVGNQSENGVDHWSDNYYKKANELGFLKNVSMNDRNAPATRGNIAIMIYNAMHVKSKSEACKLTDGLYEQPLQATWPDKRAAVQQFYKYENIVYYPVTVRSNNRNDYRSSNGIVSEYYLYSYNCATTKVLDMNIHLGERLQIADRHNEYMLLYGLSNFQNTYALFNSKNMKLQVLDLKNNENLKAKVQETLKPFYDNSTETKRIQFGEIKSQRKRGFYGGSSGFTISEVTENAIDAIQLFEIDNSLHANIILVVSMQQSDGSYKLEDVLILGKINLLTQEINLL